MSPRSILIAILALVTLAALPGAAQADAPSGTTQWRVANASSVSNGTEYQLFNGGARIGYENRTFGVDLGWNQGSKGGHFVFMRDSGKPNVRDHRAGPLAEDQRVAIYNTKTRKYLRFHERGIWKAELEWDRSPQYQWELHGQNGPRFALFNTKVRRYLVHQVKNYGINLGWHQSGPPPVQSFSVPLSAQPVVQGFIPFVGSFGGGTQGKLLSVQNASTSSTLRFVKPGKQTSDCGNPDATITVAPRASLTAEQMKTLYGVATPRLPVNFLACVANASPVTLTHLNITYQLDG